MAGADDERIEFELPPGHERAHVESDAQSSDVYEAEEQEEEHHQQLVVAGTVGDGIVDDGDEIYHHSADEGRGSRGGELLDARLEENLIVIS